MQIKNTRLNLLNIVLCYVIRWARRLSVSSFAMIGKILNSPNLCINRGVVNKRENMFKDVQTCGDICHIQHVLNISFFRFTISENFLYSAMN